MKSFGFDDIVSQSDIFFDVLPVYKKGKLYDKIQAKLTAKEKGSKYEVSVEKEDKLASKFAAKETFSEYYDTEAAIKVNNKPSTEMSAKFTDKLIPVEGVALTLKAAGSPQGEHLSASINYNQPGFDFNFGGAFKTPVTLFGFADEEALEKARNNLTTDFLFNFYEDYYLGAKIKYELPLENSNEALYVARGVLGVKTEQFEGGIYDKYEKVDVKGTITNIAKVGAWATYKHENLLFRSHFAKSFLGGANTAYKGIAIDTGLVHFNEDGSKCLAQVQIVPNTTLSFGYQKKIGKAEFSIGYAKVLAFAKGADKTKSNAFRFGINLDY